jgi:NAD(P)-dependent dehydrogenase (short-subunit alcohol dehydrogenase family)
VDKNRTCEQTTDGSPQRPAGHSGDGTKCSAAGIPLNAIAPGIIRTPMVADMIATPAGVAAMAEVVPMPLNGIADPIVCANLLAFLTSPENTHLCGQVIFVDGGSDVVIRGDSTW